MFVSVMSAEAEVFIVSGLQSIDVFVGEPAMFSCHLSRHAKGRVQWWLDGTRLENGPFSVSEMAKDNVYTLKLMDLEPTDSGTVLFKTENLVSTARLIVKGTKSRSVLECSINLLFVA